MVLSKNIRDANNELQKLLKKYAGTLDEIQTARINLEQELIIEEPTAYVARTTNKKSGIEYFTAKTNWPIEGGKTKEIKIYLGKATDFDNDTKNGRAKKLAIKKMKETLRRRKDLGEI